ncbi:MAG: hypothetical protein A2W31_15160 [Planctomycetes bacterium RBG_16_64_10]|nr:MAG: hypothetical protein A2W31_15160 [Planctomycetes bacterium RBG_16_64_10]
MLWSVATDRALQCARPQWGGRTGGQATSGTQRAGVPVARKSLGRKPSLFYATAVGRPHWWTSHQWHPLRIPDKQHWDKPPWHSQGQLGSDREALPRDKPGLIRD